MKHLEVRDIIQRVSVNIHTDRKETVLYEKVIDRVTKRYAFADNWKFKREPYMDDYERIDSYDSHSIFYKLKLIK